MKKLSFIVVLLTILSIESAGCTHNKQQTPKHDPYIVKAMPTISIPDSIVINDPYTLPQDTIIKLDGKMISKEKAASISSVDNLCYILTIDGNKLQLNLDSRSHPDDIVKVASEGRNYQNMQIPVGELASLSVRDIVGYSPFELADVLAITYNGRYVNIILKQERL